MVYRESQKIWNLAINLLVILSFTNKLGPRLFYLMKFKSVQKKFELFSWRNFLSEKSIESPKIIFQVLCFLGLRVEQVKFRRSALSLVQGWQCWSLRASCKPKQWDLNNFLESFYPGIRKQGLKFVNCFIWYYIVILDPYSYLLVDILKTGFEIISRNLDFYSFFNLNVKFINCTFTIYIDAKIGF